MARPCMECRRTLWPLNSYVLITLHIISVFTITEHGLAIAFCPVENEEVLPKENAILPNENYTFSTIK